MSIKHELLRSEYWRKKAEEARATADQMDDQVAKGMALKIADMYDALAGRAAERERRTEKPAQDSN
jgi:hypothetical protein